MHNPTPRRTPHAAHGFTLIEVLLVVAILGILATIAVVRFGGHLENSKIVATRGSIDAVSKAVEMYQIRTDRLPSSLQDLTQETDKYPAPLDRVPTDAWGTEFQFGAKGNFKYEIRSAGPDQQMGSGDDITN